MSVAEVNSADTPRPVLLEGRWQAAMATGTFRANDPATGAALDVEFPVSGWADCEKALAATARASGLLRDIPAETTARFLEAYASGMEGQATILCATACRETALPVTPRLAAVELPRAVGQLRQAAVAVRNGSWKMATIDKKLNIRSMLAPLGSVLIFGPNNFPFAFNAISGGDFAAAIAAGNAVICKAHPLHPATSELLAQHAYAAALATGFPTEAVQMVYHMSAADGLRMAGDQRLAAVAFTGGRAGGLALKTEAEKSGRLFYGEMSSVNPVVLLPGVLDERFQQIVQEFVGSSLMGAGQFCTNPGLLLLEAGGRTDAFLAAVAELFRQTPPGALFSRDVLENLCVGVATLVDAGATVVTGGHRVKGNAYRFENTLLRVSAEAFFSQPQALQREVFGNAVLAVEAASPQQTADVVRLLEGNLTGCIYAHSGGADDAAYRLIAPVLRQRVGRLINDKMPTGVMVNPAMQHGGPFPAASHPHFTAVGIPASLRRFTKLECYDGVRAERLPLELRDTNANPAMWRQIDAAWTQGNA